MHALTFHIYLKGGLSQSRVLPQLLLVVTGLYYALSHHCVGHFHEAGNVGALHVVDVAIRLCSVFYALVMDIVHNAMELFVDFGFRP